MKILQIPYSFYPDPVGETEIYVAALIRKLREKDIESVIAAPGSCSMGYYHKETRVRRFLAENGKSEVAVREFTHIFKDEQPDIVHLHALRGITLPMLEEIKRKKIPLIFTYHAPEASCERGTLLYWGKDVCDGALKVNRCSRCVLHGRGMGRLTSHLTGGLPSFFGRLLGKLGLSGGIWTALRMTELMKIRHQNFRLLLNQADHIIATAVWARDLLIRNGVPEEKITLSRQGLCYEHPDPGPEPSEHKIVNQGPLKMVFLGRMNPAIGLHVLIEALELKPKLDVTLDVYANIQEEDIGYQSALHSLIKEDRRIVFHHPLSEDRILSTLELFDVVAVPSQSVETGPLVVSEAFAAGVPVIAPPVESDSPVGSAPTTDQE